MATPLFVFFFFPFNFSKSTWLSFPLRFCYISQFLKSSLFKISLRINVRSEMHFISIIVIRVSFVSGKEAWKNAVIWTLHKTLPFVPVFGWIKSVLSAFNSVALQWQYLKLHSKAEYTFGAFLECLIFYSRATMGCRFFSHFKHLFSLRIWCFDI